MADNILRLKVDSQEYDQKIRRAAEGIQQYAQKCREVGGTLTKLDDGVLEFVQALGKMDTVATSSRQQLREMSNALTTLTMTYRDLTDEEKASPFGQELSKGIQQLTERAGQAKDAMMDVEASIRNAASDTRLFDQLAQGASVMTAGFQGLTGAGKMLGIEMGNDVEVIAKLQSAMAVTNSLTTIQTALQNESALMQGIMAIKTNAAATAQSLLARNTVIATAAGKAFNLVAKASPLGLIVTAAAAATAAVVLFGEKSEKVSQQEKDRREVAIRQMQREQAERKRLADRAKEESDAIRNSTGDVIAKYKILQAEWNTLKTAQEKNTFLKDNASAFDALGASIKTAADAQKFFVEQSDKVIKALSAMARAEAMKDLLKEQYKKNASFDPNNVDKSQYKVSTAEMRQLSPSNRSTTYLANGKTPTAYSKSQQDSYIQNFIRQNPELSAAGLTASDYRYYYAKAGTGQMEYHMNVSGLSKLEEYRKNNYLTKLQDEADTHTKFLEGQLEEAATEAAKAQSGISAFKGGGSTNNENGAKTELQRNQTKITNLSDEYVSATDERRAAIREEIVALQQRNEEIEKLQKEAVEGIDVNSLFPDVGQTKTSAESYGEQLRKSIIAGIAEENQQADVNAIKNLMDVVIRNSIEGVDIPVDDLMERIFGNGEDIAGRYFQDIVEKVNKQLREIGRDEIEIDVNTGKVNKKNKDANKEENQEKKYLADGLNKLTSGLNGIDDSFKNLGVDLGDGFRNVVNGISGVTTILTTISTIVSAIQVIAAADALIPFARGGIVPHAANGYFVPGTHYSGDVTPILANAGELVLNKSQQANLASLFSGDNGRTSDISPYLTGEMLFLGLQAFTRRSGMGEIVTTNRR